MNRYLLALCIPLAISTAPALAECTSSHVEPPASALAQDYGETDRMISYTVTFDVAMPSQDFNAKMATTPLENFMPGTKKIPGVVGSRPLAGRPFGQPGAPRLVCLNDGSTATEEVIVSEPGKVFKYRVWNYTADISKPILYAIGTFALTPIDTDHVRVDWTYAFKLDERHFPGNLGGWGAGSWITNFYAPITRT